jgi:hypothetical protein
VSGGESVRFRWERAFRGAAIGSASVLALGLTLATYADTDGASIFPGQDRLSADLGLSRSTIQRSQDRLEELGWISRKGTSNRRAGKAQEWRLTFPVKASPVMPTEPNVKASPAMPTEDEAPAATSVKASPVMPQQTIYISPPKPATESAGSSESPSLSEAEIVALIAQAPSFDDEDVDATGVPASAVEPAKPTTTAELEDELPAMSRPGVADDSFRSSPRRIPHAKEAIYSKRAWEREARDQGFDPETGEYGERAHRSGYRSRG